MQLCLGVSGQICCGLCIYRRQYGLRVCCGNDDEEVAPTSRGPRKTHVVLAAQYNRAFDDSAPAAVDHQSARVVGDQSPSSMKKNGVVTSTESAIADEASAPLSDSENADREAAADDVEVGDANQAQTNVADDELKNDIKATANDSSDRIDNVISGPTSSDDSVTSPTGNDAPVTRSLTGNEKSETVSRDRSAVADDVLTDTTPEPETKNYSRRKKAPGHRRCRSLGTGSRPRREIDSAYTDKAVNVHEDDLVAQPEPEIVTESERGELSEATTDEERQDKAEDTAKEESGEENKTEDKPTTQTVSADESAVRDPRMLGNLVLDLDELGLLTPAQDVKEDEVSDLCTVT